MKIVLLKYTVLLTVCSLLMACGQSGKLYLPNQEAPIQATNNINKA